MKNPRYVAARTSRNEFNSHPLLLSHTQTIFPRSFQDLASHAIRVPHSEQHIESLAFSTTDYGRDDANKTHPRIMNFLVVIHLPEKPTGTLFTPQKSLNKASVKGLDGKVLLTRSIMTRACLQEGECVQIKVKRTTVAIVIPLQIEKSRREQHIAG